MMKHTVFFSRRMLRGSQKNLRCRCLRGVRRLALLVCFLMATAFGTASLGASPRRESAPQQEPAPLPGASQRATSPLRVGIMPDADSLPFMVARDEGFFSREGVNVELISFSNFQERDAALQAGRIDGAISDLLAAVFFAAGGFDVRAVSLTDGRYGIIGSPQSANSSLAGLRGQKIAISSNTIIHYTTIAQMEAAGIPEDAYELIAVPRMPLRLEMLLSGQVAAACLPEPFLTAAAGQGAVPLSTTDTLGIDAGVIVFSKKVLDERLDDAILFFRAVYNASLKINANPQSYREYLVEQAAFPAEVKDTYRFVTYRKPTLPDTRQIEQVIRWLKSRDLLEADVQAGDLIDPRIAAAASAW